MKAAFLIITMTITTLCSACYKNPIERNTIVFKDNIQDVQNSLLEIQKLLFIMPKSQTELNTNYYYQNNNLYLNNTIIGNPDSILVDTVKAFLNFNNFQKKKFIELSKYLKRNYITSGYLEDNQKLWFYEYRNLVDGDFHDTREIVVLNDASNTIPELRKVLDHKKKIFLLAPKDAKIR